MSFLYSNHTAGTYDNNSHIAELDKVIPSYLFDELGVFEEGSSTEQKVSDIIKNGASYGRLNAGTDAPN